MIAWWKDLKNNLMAHVAKKFWFIDGNRKIDFHTSNHSVGIG